MRPLEQLIDTKDPGWPLVEDGMKKAKNKIEVLPCDTAKAKRVLYLTQVTTRSTMGSVIFIKQAVSSSIRKTQRR